MTAPKKYDDSGQTGDAGIALIHSRVLEMGYVWHERQRDVGIDGMVELRDKATGAATNRHVLVQSKATERRFQGETDTAFHYLCDARDIDYWMRAENPVVLVCSHPSDRLAWWVDVTRWFADPARRRSRLVVFDKNAHRFDADAAHRLMTLADPHATAHTPVAAAKPETLTSNMVPVTLPPVAYSSPTDVTDPAVLLRRQRDTGEPVRHDWSLTGGHLWTWSSPATSALRVVASGPPETVDVAAWAEDEDPARRRDLVRLLNGGLRQDVAADCDWDNKRRHVYFRASEDLAVLRTLSETGRMRKVFNPRQRRDGTGVGYCQHAALRWRFDRLEGAWFCCLEPTYHFTGNGTRPSAYSDVYLSGIKRLERNAAVLGSTRMWAAYLLGQETLFHSPERILGYGRLVPFSVDRGIDDKEWRADHRDAPDGPPDEDAVDGDWDLWPQVGA